MRHYNGWYLYFCRNGHPQVYDRATAHKETCCMANADERRDHVPLRHATPAEFAQWVLLGEQWDCVPLEDS